MVSDQNTIGVIGAGAMGRATAWWLAQVGVEAIEFCDIEESQAVASAEWLACQDITCKVSVRALKQDGPFPTIVGGWRAAYLCIPAGPTVDLLRRFGRDLPKNVVSITRVAEDDLADLDKIARDIGANWLLHMGLEPGLTELIALEIMDAIGTPEAMSTFCGGLVFGAREPFFHSAMIGGGLSGERRPAWQLNNGVPEQVRRYDGLETLSISPFGEVEAYHDGMMPQFARLLKERGVRRACQKTLRWQGFTRAATTLEDAGLLSRNEGPTGFSSINAFTQSIIAHHFERQPDAIDATVLGIEARNGNGTMLAHRHIEVKNDPNLNLSSMAILTGAAAAANFIAPLVGGEGAHLPQNSTPSSRITFLRALANMLGTRASGEFVTEQNPPLSCEIA